MTAGSREALVDGGLAATVLAVVLAAGVAVDARPAPAAAAGGAGGAVLLELLLSRRRRLVRRAWRRPGARVGALLAGIALCLAVATVAPDAGLSALAGGLATYLAVLVVAVAVRSRG